MEIVVRKDGELWSAYDDSHKIVSGKCKSCVVNLLKKLTKNSKKYTTITIIDERKITFRTGERVDADAHSDPQI